MFTDKKGLFKEFDVVVNGKFVALLVAPCESYKKGNGEFDFYFGVYNHKYFSMCPRFNVDCYNECGSSEDFRLATDDEKKEFFEDCRSFGYEWDVKNNHFCYYNDKPYILETKKQFLDMKLPKYIPLRKIGGHKVVETMMFDNDNNDIFFILEDNYYSHLKTHYDVEYTDYTSINILANECEESFVGHHLIDGFMGEERFANLKDNDLVFGEARMCWWFLVDNFFDFPLCYNTDISPNDYSKLSSDNYSEFGKMMVKRGWVDERMIFQLAREYMQYGWFCKLCGELSNIRRIELESKKNSLFEL